jgi:hypothetical protein
MPGATSTFSTADEPPPTSPDEVFSPRQAFDAREVASLSCDLMPSYVWFEEVVLLQGKTT